MNLSDPDDALYTDKVCALCGSEDCPEAMLPRYEHDFDGSYKPGRTLLQRVEDDLKQLRYHSGLEKVPYEEGIPGLQTTLICLLNVLLNMMELLDGPSRTLPDQNPEP